MALAASAVVIALGALIRAELAPVPPGVAEGTGVGGGRPPASDAARARAPRADLVGASSQAASNGGRRHVLVVVVEGPAGPVADATVRVDARSPVAHYEPSIEAPAPDAGAAHRPPTVGVTDALGSVAFELFCDVSASIDVRSPDHLPGATTYWFKSDAQEGAVEEARVVLERGVSIEGTVVDAVSGGAVESAEAHAGSRDGDPEAVTDAAGTFRFALDRSVREQILTLTAAGYADERVTLRSWNGVVDPPSIRVRLTRPAAIGAIELTVHDGGGRPIEGAEIFAEDVTDQALDAREPISSTSRFSRGSTSTDGRFLVKALQVGRSYEVRAHAAGRADASETIRLEGSSPMRRMELTLPELGRLVVTLLDGDGHPATGFVQLQMLVQGGRPTFYAVHLPTPEAGPRPTDIGTYRFRNLEPGTFEAAATSSEWAPATGRAEVRPGEESTVTLRLVPGVSIRGVVVDREGRPVEGAVLTARSRVDEDEKAQPHFGSWPRMPNFRSWPRMNDAAPSQPVTDAHGAFTIGGLAPGPYAVTAERRVPRYGDVEPAVGSAPSQDTELVGTTDANAPSEGARVVAERLGLVRARLVRADGVPFVGSVVCTVKRSDDWNGGVLIHTVDGAIGFGGLDDGDYRFIAKIEGFAPARARVAIAQGRTVDLGILHLDGGVTIRGRVIDGEHRPVACATVHSDHGSVQSKDDGTFELEHGEWAAQDLRVEADGFIVTIARVDTSTSVDVGDLRLWRGGVVRGRLRPTATEPAGAFGIVNDGDASPDRSDPIQVRPTPDGRYLLPLAAGRWRAEWRTPGDVPHVLGRFTITEGGVVDLDLAPPTK